MDGLHAWLLHPQTSDKLNFVHMRCLFFSFVARELEGASGAPGHQIESMYVVVEREGRERREGREGRGGEGEGRGGEGEVEARWKRGRGGEVGGVEGRE